jgi:hypothetical protein
MWEGRLFDAGRVGEFSDALMIVAQQTKKYANALDPQAVGFSSSIDAMFEAPSNPVYQVGEAG